MDKCKHVAAFQAAVEFISMHDVFYDFEIIKYVLSRAGTIYFAPSRTVKDWIDDIAEIGYLEKTGYKYRRRPGVEKKLREYALREKVENC